LQEYLPLLLAFSANSPMWNGRPTGEHAHRIELLEVLPTGGLPPRMNSWGEYLALVENLQSAGFIETPKEIWWDVRPSPGFGTVEVRVCDMPRDLPAALGLVSLIQCLVKDLSDRIDAGEPARECHPFLVRQNRWRACRFGPEATLVDPVTFEAVPAREAAERLVDRLSPVAERLGCAQDMARVRDLIRRPTGSELQIDLYGQTQDLPGMVRRLTGLSRLKPAEAPSEPRRTRRRTGTKGRRGAGLNGSSYVQFPM
ncbi:MAG: glutamate-cysteine ligase family protein, partial [Vicinamibacteria bacterium]